MKKMSGMATGGRMSSDLHSGLTNKSPKAPDQAPKGPSVNDDTTRSSVAENHGTLGGRVA